MALWVTNGNKYSGSKSKFMATGEGGSGKPIDASDTFGERNTVYGKLIISNRDLLAG